MHLPDSGDCKPLRAGRIIKVHVFTKGWRFYLVLKMAPGDIQKAYVLRIL